MSTSRRDFLKTTAIAGAGVAVAGPSAFAEPLKANAEKPAAKAAAEVASAPGAVEYTRGIGIYPGAPAEDFSPTLVPDSSTYRNLALLRPAYHSSSYDYNLTAQLVTDGVKDTRLPEWIIVSDPFRGPSPKEQREVILDHSPMSALELRGAHAQVDIQLAGGEKAPDVDRVQLFVVSPQQSTPEALRFTVSVSEDGREWKPIGNASAPKPASTAAYPPDFSPPNHFFTPSLPFDSPIRSRFYRIELSIGDAREGLIQEIDTTWKLGEVAFFRGDKRVEVGGPYSFTSAWMSAGMGEEWIYVDLGSRCEFDRVKLYWIARPAEGSVQVSDDAQNWRNLQTLAGGSDPVDDLKLSQPSQGRYVRVLMTRPASPHGYILSEIEVFGRGGFTARPKPAPPAGPDGRLLLAGGSWRLQRSNFVSATGESLSKEGFQDSDWLVATVPGTVLTSYLNVGAIPDPNFGQNQLHISDSYFHSDFWYRTEFTAPAKNPQQLGWLNFDGINWKAEVYLNGEKLGRIEGGFMRGRFDVTGKLIPGKVNALAVRIEKNATPGSAKQKTFESTGKNGGGLGADNPTYHAAIGWDWIPTIRGRDTGIWGDVFLTVTEAVTIEDPFVSAKLPLPDISSADVTIAADLVNRHDRPFNGVLRGRIGEIGFEQRVKLGANERKRITLDSTAVPALRLKDPRLWWPVGYGEPYRYDVQLTLQSGGKTLDSKSLKAGLRQMTYSEEGGALKIWINGRRFIARGGNWGFGESMLRYRSREYDTAVRYHREMNFTMIRNWVGQIGDEAFWEACDRHGVVVWQDFWLANPWDGPEPDDNALFLSNVKDLVLRIRNHPCVGLYCGRNEGFPPPPLEQGIRKTLDELHPGLHYIPSSADEVVSGHGPYQAMPAKLYFRAADTRFHSEIGAPNIPPIESVRLMMPENALWPQALDWGLHDFCLQGAQNGAAFRDIIENSYGGATSAEEWIRLAQFVNYDTYRAIFEAQSRYRMGVFLWMSHPCWPSFVWQTYDYYFEPTAAYFGCKKGSEPLHIQWNCADESIEVVNYNAGNVSGLKAQVEILNMDGSRMDVKTADVDSKEDSTVACIKMAYPAGLTPVHFLRLTLTRGSETISSNFYLRGLHEGDFRAIRELPTSKVQSETGVERKGSLWQLTTKLTNNTASPALMVRLKAVREKSGDRILPAIYSDNYIALMPGESRTIVTEVNESDTRGEKPAIEVGT
jgi:Exo-beta-D-glucosaminidase Ig-fold domain/Glycosyl hydrolases family 2/F5/8 type C domain/Glycosyl hydrolases family 2, sugar binding domain/TAT (twin-arginine translocation) pathway signal sequence